MSLPERLLLAREEVLDRALALLVTRLLDAAAPDLDGAVRATAGLERARALRALLLPTAAYGASQMLIEWAHRRGMPVGVMQHGIYSHRKLYGDDYTADVLFSWGEGTADQARDWPQPQPRLVPVGVPGMPLAPPRLPGAPLRRALVATTSAGRDLPIAPLTLGEEFIGAVAPGLATLAAAGVKLELRLHPNEDPERWRRLLARHDLPVTLAAGGSFAAASARTDIVIASASSVAFEAAALGVPVLMWNGGAPEWLRREFLMAPWSGSLPGMFGGVEDFNALVGLLLERTPVGLDVARELRGHLARYAQPFDPVAFAEGLRLLGA